MIFRLRWTKQGGHYHCRLFEASKPNTTWRRNGELVFDETSWPAATERFLAAGFEILEEGQEPIEWPHDAPDPTFAPPKLSFRLKHYAEFLHNMSKFFRLQEHLAKADPVADPVDKHEIAANGYKETKVALDGIAVEMRAIAEAEIGAIETMQARGYDIAIIAQSYGFTIDNDSQILGLVAGDHGYEPTGMYLDAYSKEWLDKLMNASRLAGNP